MQVSDFSATDGQRLKTDTALLGRLRVPAGNRATGVPSEGERGGTQARQAQAEQQGQMQPQDRQVPGEEATGRSAWLVGRDAFFLTVEGSH